ncbi:MAG: TonB-dependent receptor [Calditrichaeota bacterium]|nr:TonB-dependent receptor [Calditrichota bacterium]
MGSVKKIILSLLLVGAFCQPNFARGGNRGAISGTVLEIPSGIKLPGVNIQIVGTTLGTSTDRNGRFVIRAVPPGNFVLLATMIGHKPARTKPIFVSPGKTVNLTIQLEESTIDFDPVIVTANKTSQELDVSANSISVVSAQEIARRAPLSVQGILETVPGVTFVKDQINIRGSSGFTIGAANRTLLLVDGVPVMASDTGEFNWDLLPVLDVERIEVMKGAGSALWGTAALGGVVNIITKSPSEQGKTMVRFHAGEYGEPRYDEWKWTDKPLYFARIDVSHGRQIGPLGIRLSAGRAISTGYTQSDDYRRWNFTGKFNYRFRNGSNWVFYAALNRRNESLYIGWDDPKHPFEVKPSNRSRGRMKMANFYTKYNWLISAKAAVNFRLSYLMTLMGNQFVQTADFNPAKGLGSEIQGLFFPRKNWNIIAGLEFKWDTGSTKYFGDHQGYTIGVYAQTEIELLKKIRLTPGVRYDRYHVIDGVSQSLLSPRIGLNYRPSKKTVLRASAGSGFRAATIAERYLNFENSSVAVEANPNLKAETSWSYDFGWRQYLTKNWFVEAGAFRNDFKNLIEIDLRQSQIEFAKDIRVAVKFENLLQARIQGIELTTGGHWWKRRIRLTATATFLDHENLQTHQPLTYRPKNTIFISPAFCLGPVEFQADFHYASAPEAVKLFAYDERVPQKVWNFRFIYHYANFDFQIAANNAFDYYYTQIERNMAEVRNFTVGMTATF